MLWPSLTLAMAVAGPVILDSGCNKQPPPTPQTTPPLEQKDPKEAVKPVEKPAPLPPVGMVEPFPHLTNAAGKPFNSGWAAMKAKKYDDAAAAFTEVTTALPDYLQARFQAARAHLLANNATATRQELEALLSRNYVAYAGRAENGKEFAAFRTSPEFPAYQKAAATLHTAYAQGLDRGFTLIGRSGGVDAPAFAPGKTPGVTEAKLELKQEAYHYDVDSSRYRPLTATDGHVLTAMRSSDGKRLAFISVDKLESKDGKSYFATPQFGFIDLTTLETAGPLPLAGAHEELVIGFSDTGTPVIATAGARAGSEGLEAGAYEIDTARTGLAKSAGKPPFKGERVTVRYGRLVHGDRLPPADATLAEDRHSISLGAAGIITSARTLAEGSLAWSPGQRYFAYAGLLDACAVQKDEKAKAAQNELFVYEAEKKAAARVDAGPSAFSSLWLSDYLLAYENGSGEKATLNLYDLTTRKKTTMPLKHGAGLYGLPTLNCPAEVPPAGPSPAAAAPAAPAAPVAAPAISPPPAAPAAPAAPTAPTQAPATP